MTVFNHAQLENLWIAVGGRAADADTAAAIAQAESGGDSTAIRNSEYRNLPNYRPPDPGAQPEFSVGLWQVNLLQHTQYNELEMLDPTLNARAALQIYVARGNFSDWTTWKDGTYSIHLTGVGPGGTFTPTGTDPNLRPVGAHTGWHEINLAMSRHLPAALFTSNRVAIRTAANLARRRK